MIYFLDVENELHSKIFAFRGHLRNANAAKSFGSQRLINIGVAWVTSDVTVLGEEDRGHPPDIQRDDLS